MLLLSSLGAVFSMMERIETDVSVEFFFIIFHLSFGLYQGQWERDKPKTKLCSATFVCLLTLPTFAPSVLMKGI